MLLQHLPSVNFELPLGRLWPVAKDKNCFLSLSYSRPSFYLQSFVAFLLLSYWDNY